MSATLRGGWLMLAAGSFAGMLAYANVNDGDGLALCFAMGAAFLLVLALRRELTGGAEMIALRIVPSSLTRTTPKKGRQERPSWKRTRRS